MIREAREARGIGAADFAGRIRATQPELSRWECRVRVPDRERAALIAAELELDPDLLEIWCGRAPESLREDPIAWARRRAALEPDPAERGEYVTIPARLARDLGTRVLCGPLTAGEAHELAAILYGEKVP